MLLIFCIIPTEPHIGGGVQVADGFDADASEVEARLKELQAEIVIRGLQEELDEYLADRKSGDDTISDSEIEILQRQIRDMQEAIYCATGLQAYVYGGEKLKELRKDPRVSAVMKIHPWTTVASGDPAPEEFEDCVKNASEQSA